MKKYIALMSVVFSLMFQSVAADPGIEAVLSVSQQDSSTGTNKLLLKDTVRVIRSVTATGFFLNFSIDFNVNKVDSMRTSFDIHLVTLGPNAATRSRAFTVEYDLPAKITDIPGKNGAFYTLEIRPLKMIEIERESCSYNHRIQGQFDRLPTANTDIYFVPNSLGDFYFDAVKDIMETQYRSFSSLFNFNLPGKYSIYLCPCPLATVLWDKRFYMMADPTRNTGFALYGAGLNTADPFLLIHTAVLTNLGYAPPFLSEGVAGYLSVSVFDMKEIIADKKQIPFSDLLDTYTYLNADAWVADRTAASFVRYLINAYDLAWFKRLYRQSDDLSLKINLETVYGASIETLEVEWLNYIDTTTITIKSLSFQSFLSEMMFNYTSMLHYCKAAADQSRGSADSLRTFSALKRAYFFNGEYYQATLVQETLNGINPTSAPGWMTLGSYQMMNGYYQKARASLEKALTINPEDNLAKFNLGLNKLFTGDTTAALELFSETVMGGPRAQVQVEGRIMLGLALNAYGDGEDKKKAADYLSEALISLNQSLSANNSSPSSQMWAGIASLVLGHQKQAIEYLNVAYFLETRPFYLGMIHLWLGKASDLSGDRQDARDHYGQVLALPSADYHQQEARQLLESPYKL